MKKFFFGFIICLVVICALAWTPTDRMFNRNQFGTNNFSINIKSGALVTNLVVWEGLTSKGAGTGSEIFGLGAVAPGDDGTAVGRNAQANQENATAVGEGSGVDAALGTAIGAESQVTGSAGTAIGGASSAEHTQSTAIGATATTTADNQVRLGTAAEHVSIPGPRLEVAGTIYSTNLTASRPVFSDANKGLVSTTIDIIPGSNVTVTTNVVNRVWTINSTGGGSGDTNGISYVDGSLLIDAVRTRRDAGDNHVLDLVWTNNVSALVFTNQDTASSIYFRYMNGHIPLFMTEGAGIFINSELDLQLSADSVLAIQANTDVRTLNNTNGTTVIDFSGDTVVIAGGVNLDEINATTLNVNRFNISTNLYGNTTSVNFANSRSTTNLAGNLVFDAGLLNFSATNYNELILHCYGDGANRTVTAPTGWTTTRSDHVVTNGQWSWILVSAQIGVFTNMAQVDFPNEP